MLKAKSNPKGEKMDRKDKIVAAALFAVLVVLLAVSPFLPDKNPDIIRKQLSEAGYEVQGIEFTRTEGFSKLIYEASQPIDVRVGDPVESWQLVDYSFSRLSPRYRVVPYPSRPVEPPVKVTLQFSQSEYERLQQISDSQDLEQFIKQKILKGGEATKEDGQ